MCVYSTKLELILPKISKKWKTRSAPPPAAAKRRPASQKNFLYNSDFARATKNSSKKEKKVFLLGSARLRASGGC